MKTLVAFVALIGVAAFWITQDNDEPLDREQIFTDLAGQEYSFDELRKGFKSAEGILAGQFNASGPFSKNGTGVSLQTFYQFERGFKTYRGDIATFDDGGKKWQLMFYDGDEDSDSHLDLMQASERYVMLLSKLHDRKKVICFEETESLLNVLNVWSKKGVYSEADVEKLTEDSDWIVSVRLLDESCGESYPCQHHWEFEVLERTKGEGIPDRISIRGNYRDHSEIPFPLKSLRGKVKLFLKQDAARDSEVIANFPAGR